MFYNVMNIKRGLTCGIKIPERERLKQLLCLKAQGPDQVTILDSDLNFIRHFNTVTKITSKHETIFNSSVAEMLTHTFTSDLGYCSSLCT